MDDENDPDSIDFDLLVNNLKVCSHPFFLTDLILLGSGCLFFG